MPLHLADFPLHQSRRETGLAPIRIAARRDQPTLPQIANRVAVEFEARAHALLGAWFSELEPDLFVGADLLPFGIGARGTGVATVALAQCAPQFVECHP